MKTTDTNTNLQYAIYVRLNYECGSLMCIFKTYMSKRAVHQTCAIDCYNATDSSRNRSCFFLSIRQSKQ